MVVFCDIKTEEIKVEGGLKQGGVLSPLFARYPATKHQAYWLRTGHQNTSRDNPRDLFCWWHGANGRYERKITRCNWPKEVVEKNGPDMTSGSKCKRMTYKPRNDWHPEITQIHYARHVERTEHMITYNARHMITYNAAYWQTLSLNKGRTSVPQLMMDTCSPI